MIHVWKRTVIIEVTVISERQAKRESWVGRMHRVGRVLSFIFSRQNCFFPTPHPQSNVSRAKGKRGGTHSLASEGVGVTERDSVSTRGYTLWYSISICTMC
jgi:hypothetical protein